MLSVVSSDAAAPPVRAPLLASADNPNGYSIREVLAQLGDEIAAGNAAFRGSADLFDRSELSLRQGVQQALAQGVSLGMMIDTMAPLRARAAEEAVALAREAAPAAHPGIRQIFGADALVAPGSRDPRLRPGTYHPVGWPARDAA